MRYNQEPFLTGLFLTFKTITKWMKDNEYNLFPTIHPDFLDALSRIYDMDAVPPRMRRGRVLEPAIEAAY